MSQTIVDSLRTIQWPGYAKGKPNAMCMSPNGIIVALSSDGSLSYCIGRDSAQHRFRPLPINFDPQSFRSFAFTHGQFNPDGSLLLLYSRFVAAVVEIPENLVNTTVNCNFVIIINALESDEHLANPEIIHCTFYPYSSKHVVVLFPGALEIFDLVTGSVQSIPINIGHSFVSFCFGPLIDWMALSILLLDTAGRIFVLCPVLPRGAKLPTALIDNLHAWVDAKQLDIESSADQVMLSFIDSVKMFLYSIGDINSSEDQVNVAGGFEDMTRFNQHFELSVSLKINSPLDKIASLQGPCVMVGRGGEFPLGPNVSACDICVPGSNNSTMQSAAPVVIVSFTDGSVCAFVFGIDDALTPEFVSIAPQWQVTDLDCPQAGPMVTPTFAWVEKIKLPLNLNSITTRENVKLEADPVLPHGILITVTNRAAAFFLSLNWMVSVSENIGDCVENVQDDISHLGKGAQELRCSTCIPIYCPKDSSTGLPSVSLSAATISFDPFLGHFGCFASSDGNAAIVNLTVHNRLSSLLGKTISQESSTVLEPRAMTESFVDTQRVAFEEKVSELVKIAAVGLGTIPSYQETALQTIVKAGGSEVAQDIVITKALFTASEHIKKEVVLPLFELSQRLQFKLESVESLYAAQTRLLRGHGAEKGLLVEIRNLNADFESLDQRVAAMAKNFETQKQKAESLLTAITFLRTKISSSERAYHNQLRSWASEATRLEAVLAALKLKASRFCSENTVDSPRIGNDTIAISTPDSKFQPSIKITTPVSGPPTSVSGGAHSGSVHNLKKSSHLSQPLYSKRVTPTGRPLSSPFSLSTPSRHLNAGLEFQGGSVLDDRQGQSDRTPSKVDSPYNLTTTGTPIYARQAPVGLSRAPSAMPQLSNLEIVTVANMQRDQTGYLQDYVKSIVDLESRINKMKQRLL